MTARIIDGKEVAAKVHEEVAAGVAECQLPKRDCNLLGNDEHVPGPSHVAIILFAVIMSSSLELKALSR